MAKKKTTPPSKASSLATQGKDGGKEGGDGSGARYLAARHLRFGWWSLVVFVSLGAILEMLHGLKIGFYLDLAHETRRLMWTLAHAHGTLLALVNLAFAGTVKLLAPHALHRAGAASLLLRVASVMLPAGFFLGGIVVYGGDPNPAILLVPVGAAALVVSALLTALGVTRGTGAREDK